MAAANDINSNAATAMPAFVRGPLTGRMRISNDFDGPRSTATRVSIESDGQVLWAGDPRDLYADASRLVAQMAEPGRANVAWLHDQAVKYLPARD
jgi:hypothetical protein